MVVGHGTNTNFKMLAPPSDLDGGTKLSAVGSKSECQGIFVPPANEFARGTKIVSQPSVLRIKLLAFIAAAFTVLRLHLSDRLVTGVWERPGIAIWGSG